MTWYEQAESIGEAIRQNAPEVVDGALVTGWALVVEWMDSDGNRWLSKLHPPHVTSWAAAGMHHEALAGEWPDP